MPYKFLLDAGPFEGRTDQANEGQGGTGGWRGEGDWCGYEDRRLGKVHWVCWRCPMLRASEPLRR